MAIKYQNIRPNHIKPLVKNVCLIYGICEISVCCALKCIFFCIYICMYVVL